MAADPLEVVPIRPEPARGRGQAKHGPNRRAVARTITAHRRAGRLGPADAAAVEVALTSAEALDGEMERVANGARTYTLAPIMRAHLAALKALAEAAEPSLEDDQTLLERLFADAMEDVPGPQSVLSQSSESPVTTCDGW